MSSTEAATSSLCSADSRTPSPSRSQLMPAPAMAMAPVRSPPHRRLVKFMHTVVGRITWRGIAPCDPHSQVARLASVSTHDARTAVGNGGFCCSPMMI